MTSAKRYTRITKEEFEQFLAEINYDFEIVNHPSGEYVYEHSNPIKKHPEVSVRIFSTIDKRTDVSREKDSDAIRTVIWDDENEFALGGKTKTLRIKTWKKNLRDKIVETINDTNSMICQCKECNTGWLIEREGQYGKFLGCTRYPSCSYTEKL